MEIYTKEGWLYYVQTDHLRGEEIGPAIDYLYNAGAHNVQVVSAVTKKNRPGYIFFIDTDANHLDSVEEAIILELRVSGWHLISSKHRHLEVDYLKCSVPIVLEDLSIEYSAEIKKAYGVEETIRPEFRSCKALKEILEKNGKRCSIDTCAQLIREGYKKVTVLS